MKDVIWYNSKTTKFVFFWQMRSNCIWMNQAYLSMLLEEMKILSFETMSRNANRHADVVLRTDWTICARMSAIS